MGRSYWRHAMLSIGIGAGILGILLAIVKLFLPSSLEIPLSKSPIAGFVLGLIVYAISDAIAKRLLVARRGKGRR